MKILSFILNDKTSFLRNLDSTWVLTNLDRLEMFWQILISKKWKCFSLFWMIRHHLWQILIAHSFWQILMGLRCFDRFWFKFDKVDLILTCFDQFQQVWLSLRQLWTNFNIFDLDDKYDQILTRVATFDKFWPILTSYIIIWQISYHLIKLDLIFMTLEIMKSPELIEKVA